jgi:putative ABC transport system permease protein
VRSGLVVIEMALALILLVGAGLLIKSFWQLRQIQPGFNPNNLLTLRLELPESRYKEASKQMQFRRALLDLVNSLPGVRAALVSELPMSGDWLHHDFTREGWNLPTGDEPPVQTRSVMGDYFRAMQMPLLTGRDFTPQDKEDAPLVGIANQTLVESHFKNENPIGKRVRWARNAPDVWITIVGLVGDVKHFGLDRPEEPALYTPYAQAGAPWKRWNMLVVRTPGEPMAFAEAVKRQIWQVDPQLPVTKLQAMPDVMSLSFAERRFNMLLLGLFAAVALVLAGVGIYGVVSYAVAQRTREIGIRMALGAQRQDVLKLVVRQGMTLALAGIGIGLVAALPLTRFLQTLLFGIKGTDPATYAVISLILIAVALAACFLPARRATKVDPMIALRYE